MACALSRLWSLPLLKGVLLDELHGGLTTGHLGEMKTLDRLKQRFYWPGHYQDVQNWCKSTCATRKTAAPRNRAPLDPIQIGSPAQLVSVNLLGPFPENRHGNKYVLVAVDHFTKWSEAYALPNQEAMTVAQKLTQEWFFRFSPPETLHSDQGRQFESKLIQEICKILQIKKSRTSPYHPQCNGITERCNRTLLTMLATAAKDNPAEWEEYLRPLCLAYNSSVHASTGFTPFYLTFGREARLPVDLSFGTGDRETLLHTDYVQKIQASLAYAYDIVRDTLGNVQTRQKNPMLQVTEYGCTLPLSHKEATVSSIIPGLGRM